MLSSCSHYYYVPSSPHVHLFEERNDCSIAVSGEVPFPWANQPYSLSAQTAYAITNHIAVSANAMTAWRGERSSGNWGNGKYYDVALGYFTPIDRLFIFEVYGGVGTSHQHHEYDVRNKGTADLSFNKYFLQPSIGLKIKRIELAFTAGLSRVVFTNVIYTPDIKEMLFVQVIDNNRNALLLDPSFTFRVGNNYTKFQVQAGISLHLSRPYQQFAAGRASMGISFSFAERFLKKQTKE